MGNVPYKNIKLTIEYEGTDYCGWQIQDRHQVTRSQGHQRKSMQETIEKVLRKILQEKIRLVASGRTDAGVHAEAQVANFKTRSKIPLDKLQVALNGLLPDDIAITKIEEADLDFHSRFAAKSKIYRYAILNRAYPSALLRNRVYFCRYHLDVGLMRKEAKVLLGRHNFQSFQASDAKEGSAVRVIKRINIAKDKDLIHINIEASGFLKNMARNIVGTLIEIGRGKFKKGDLKRILLVKDRRRAGPTAPACGLCLVRVKY